MDVDLIIKAKSGDKDALVKLIMEKKEDYYRLAYLYMGNKEDSLDGMEDMIVILYEQIRRLKKPESFYPWSKTILVNCCKKILREKSRIIPTEQVENGSFIAGYGNWELSHDLKSHMNGLSPQHQEAIKLRYFLDLDYYSIAQLLGLPVGTVKSRISIGLKRLRESFGGEYL